MRLRLIAAGLCLLAFTPAAAAAPQLRQPLLVEIGAEVSPQALHATIAGLVGFGTRHTLSDTASPTRGIGAARRWVKRSFQELGQGCGGCLEIVTPEQTVTGPRAPTPTVIRTSSPSSAGRATRAAW
ncbi:MAG TPA: hypothetical protein VGF50_08555 [Caulobacteraceae bacterium]|jgi:hypothetical protein